MAEKKFIHINGSQGEGGGQVLRASLALSVALGRPFAITGIRAGRPKPGLKRQHLACVKAAQEISAAEVSGAAINSTELTFNPGRRAKGGDYHFDVGGGGSATLVLQTVLPPLMATPEPSRVSVCGGTHVPMAPIYEFFEQSLLPRLAQMGPAISARLTRTGFMQVGGGLIEVDIKPQGRLNVLNETEDGEVVELSAVIRSFGLENSIAEREAAVLNKLRDLKEVAIENHSPDGPGPGNLIILKLVKTNGTAVTSGIAQRGLAAEKVARGAANRMLQFMGAHVPVDACLADQLIVPMALAGGGSFLTEKPTLHTLTVMELLPEFTDLQATAAQTGPRAWLIDIRGKA